MMFPVVHTTGDIHGFSGRRWVLVAKIRIAGLGGFAAGILLFITDFTATNGVVADHGTRLMFALALSGADRFGHAIVIFNGVAVCTFAAIADAIPHPSIVAQTGFLCAKIKTRAMATRFVA